MIQTFICNPFNITYELCIKYSHQDFDSELKNIINLAFEFKCINIII